MQNPTMKVAIEKSAALSREGLVNMITLTETV
jgi:hypothetical protein